MREHTGRISKALCITVQRWAIDIAGMYEITSTLYQLRAEK